jgi:hypothetical protein
MEISYPEDLTLRFFEVLTPGAELDGRRSGATAEEIPLF